MKTPPTAKDAVKKPSEIVISRHKNGRKKVSIKFNEETRTKQSFKDECDINNIVRKLENGADVQHLYKPLRYGDFTNPVDYQQSLNLIIEAQDQFASLPAAARERFNNDPQKFLEFTHDPKNIDEMVRLGLATKRERSNERETTPPPSPTKNESPKKVVKKDEPQE